MMESDRLSSYAEKYLLSQLSPRSLSLCPTLDLVAVTASQTQLDIYRLNGQRASIIRRTNSTAAIESFCWAPSGRFVRCVWSDGIVQEYAASDGKLISSSESSNSRHSAVSSYGPSYPAWGEFLVFPSKFQHIPISAKQHTLQVDDPSRFLLNDWKHVDGLAGLTLEDAGDREDMFDTASNLPLELASIDIRGELPTLNVLPYITDPAIKSTIAPESFASQASLDLLLRPENNPSLGSPSFVTLIRLVCHPGGKIGVHISARNDPVAEVNVTNWSNAAQYRVVAHASNPFSTCFSMLTTCPTKSSPNTNELGTTLTILSFPSILTTGYVMYSAMKLSNTLHALSGYIIQTILCIRSAWNSARDLPSKFIANIMEALAECKELELVPSLYQLAVTGHCLPVLKGWIADELGDRNHKRWDTAVVTGYTKMVELVHEHLLPALDHASVTTSALHSLPGMPLPSTRSLTTVLHLDNLRLVGHCILRYAAEELRQFRMFSTWLSHQIPLLGTEPGSSSAKEAAIAAAAIDHGLVLAYIVGPLIKSRLELFLGVPSSSLQALPRFVPSSSAQLKRLLDKHALKVQPITCDAMSVDCVNLLHQGLWLQCDLFKHNIANLILPGHSTLQLPVLEDKEPVLQDVRMISEAPGDDMTTYVIAMTAGKSNRMRIHRVVHPATPEVSSKIKSHQVVGINLGNGVIKGLLFGDDDLFVVLFATKDQTSLLHFPYSVKAAHFKPSSLFPGGSQVINDWREGSRLPEEDINFNIKTTKDLKPHALAIFPHSNGVGDFVPEHLYVRYHKDSRIIVLLDRERTRYRVYMVPRAQAQYIEPVDDVNHDLGLDDWVNLSMEV